MEELSFKPLNEDSRAVFKKSKSLAEPKVFNLGANVDIKQKVQDALKVENK